MIAIMCSNSCRLAGNVICENETYVRNTSNEIRADCSMCIRLRIVIIAAGLSPAHRDQLLAHEMIHARWACAEAQGQPRPHVAAEEVEAYWKGGT